MMDINPQDLIIETFNPYPKADGWSLNPYPKANGWSLNPDVGVKIYHKPTGIGAVCSLHKSPYENRISAMKEIQQLVDDFEAKKVFDPARAVPTGPDIDVEKAQKDLEKIQSDFDNGVMVCRATVLKLIDLAFNVGVERAAAFIDNEMPIDDPMGAQALYNASVGICALKRPVKESK
jgi:hypothetical protein